MTQTYQSIETRRAGTAEAEFGAAPAAESDAWDEVLMQTFPASDPPPWPGSIGGPDAPTEQPAGADRRWTR